MWIKYIKQTHSVCLVVVFLICSASSCDKGSDNGLDKDDIENNEEEDSMKNDKIIMKIDSKIFTVMLIDNSSAIAFKKMLPMTINMKELNGNEKYYTLSQSIPTNSSNPRTIQNGDLMLYGASTLVLFYKSFSTSYSYTKLGKIDDTTGLASALGSENVTVTFEVEKNNDY